MADTNSVDALPVIQAVEASLNTRITRATDFLSELHKQGYKIVPIPSWERPERSAEIMAKIHAAPDMKALPAASSEYEPDSDETQPI